MTPDKLSRGGEADTPMGRLNALARWAETELGHNQYSAKGFETTIIESVARLKTERDAAMRVVRILAPAFVPFSYTGRSGAEVWAIKVNVALMASLVTDDEDLEAAMGYIQRNYPHLFTKEPTKP